MDQLMQWQINGCKDPNAPHENTPPLNGTTEAEPESTADARLSETLAELLHDNEPSEVRPGESSTGRPLGLRLKRACLHGRVLAMS